MLLSYELHRDNDNSKNADHSTKIHSINILVSRNGYSVTSSLFMKKKIDVFNLEIKKTVKHVSQKEKIYLYSLNYTFRGKGQYVVQLSEEMRGRPRMRHMLGTEQRWLSSL